MTAILDDTFHPVLLVQVEEPFARGELEAYFARLSGVAEKSVRQGRKHVVIVTNDKVAMSAAGRSTVAAANKRYMSQAQIDATAATLIVMTGSLERGVVTAFGWLFPETMKSIRPVASMQAAFDEAMRTLESLGAPFAGDREALRSVLRSRRSAARSAGG